MGQLSTFVISYFTIFSVEMLGKASFRYISLILVIFQSLAFDDVTNIRNNDHTHDLEAIIDPLGNSMVLRIDEMQNQMEEMQRIKDEMQNQMEEMKRTIEYQAQLLEDHKYAIERVNASVGASNKYRSSTSDVVFAANIHLGSEYFLPSGTVTSYNQIVINVGNHFDGYTGKFFAPHSGVYEFWIDGMVTVAKHGYAQLRINGEMIKAFSSGLFHHGNDWSSLNGNAVVNLSAYDEVEIFIKNWHGTSNEHSIMGYEEAYFMFAGRSL